ncbi:MAG: hypothetical protein ABIJ81_04495 [Patescibacteria group bacterium]
MTPRITNQRSPYRRIVFSFLIATVAVVFLILYYTLARAFITLEINPEQEVLEATILISSNEGSGDLVGSILTAKQTLKKTFKAQGTGVKEDKASGTVTIINDHNDNQTLIATTRLLSPDKVLFRITKNVTVPSGGKTTVKAVADKPGDESEISPTKFTIPGLNTSLQSLIYAESKEPMIRQEKPGAKILASDIEDARNNLKEEITPQALASLRETLPSEQREFSVVYNMEITNTKSSHESGAEASEFDYTVEAEITGIFYDPEKLRQVVLTKLNQSVKETGKEVLTLEEESIAVTVADVAPDNKRATITVKFLGQVAWKDVSKIITKEDLLGRTQAEVENYFSAFPGVGKVEIKLTPFWVTSVPTIADHIELIIK